MWVSVSALCLIVQFFCVYEVFRTIGDPLLKFTLHSADADYGVFEQYYCDQRYYHRLMLFILVFMIIDGYYEKMVIILNKNVSFIGKLLVASQLMQITSTAFIVASLLSQKKSFTDIILNMFSLKLINNFDIMIGQFFIRHLETFHSGILKHNNFRVLENVTQKDRSTSY